MKIQYQYMMPPFFRPYKEMTAREANQYFEYYVSQIPIRIEYLQNFLDKNVDKKIRLDFTENSLVEFWDWYGDLLVEQQKTDYQENTPLHLSYGVLGISSDFAMYFGELFVQKHPTIRWGYLKKPKNHLFFHRPSLMGFQHNLCYCPEQTISVLVCSALEEKIQMKFLTLYMLGKKEFEKEVYK